MRLQIGKGARRAAWGAQRTGRPVGRGARGQGHGVTRTRGWRRGRGDAGPEPEARGRWGGSIRRCANVWAPLSAGRLTTCQGPRAAGSEIGVGSGSRVLSRRMVMGRGAGVWGGGIEGPSLGSRGIWEGRGLGG